jgi:hypothetical protein
VSARSLGSALPAAEAGRIAVALGIASHNGGAVGNGRLASNAANRASASAIRSRRPDAARGSFAKSNKVVRIPTVRLRSRACSSWMGMVCWTLETCQRVRAARAPMQGRPGITHGRAARGENVAGRALARVKMCYLCEAYVFYLIRNE